MGASIVFSGDPRQAIYAFAGVNPLALLRLPACREMHLTENWRSTAQIVRLANAMMRVSVRDKDREENSGLRELPDQASPVRNGAMPLQGPVPQLLYCKSMQWFHLQPLADAISERSLPSPGKPDACVLTHANADVETLHQNLSLRHPSLCTLALSAGEGENACASDQKVRLTGNHVVVCTVHAVKGGQFHSVFYAVRGYNNLADAQEAFWGQTDEARREELRRHYVAVTRACHRLVVVICGCYAPLWFQALFEALASAEDDVVLSIAAAPSPRPSRPLGEHDELSRANAVVHDLVRRHHLADCVLTFSDRARSLWENSCEAIVQLGDDALLAAGALANGVARRIEAGEAPLPSNRLGQLQVHDLHSAQLEFVLLQELCPNDARQRVASALRGYPKKDESSSRTLADSSFPMTLLVLKMSPWRVA